MALRLIEMVIQEDEAAGIRLILKDQTLLDQQFLTLADGSVLVRILLDAQDGEAILDLLEKRYTDMHGSRIVMLPVAATLPAVEEEQGSTPTQSPDDEQSQTRISREELYEDIKDAAQCSRVYLVLVALSTVVAAMGLYYNSVTLVIGAMVIAPILGPNVALALSTTLWDPPLLRRAVVTLLAGMALVVVLSVGLGALLHINAAAVEVSLLTRAGLGNIAVALASGTAGALAFTMGMSSALIGVMVAVALLPPLVAFGLLLGGGQVTMAMGALSLFLVNLVCINLASVTTFVLQGLYPAKWWEKNQAVKATGIAIAFWATLLAIFVGIILLLRKG